MMRKSIIVFVAIIIMFAGCTEKTSYNTDKYNYINYKKLEKPAKKTKLHSEVVIKEEDINRIGCFTVIDNYLILVDSKDDKQIKIFDLKSQNLLNSFGRRGQGPSEFVGRPWQIIPCPKDNNMFWIYDILTRKLKRFSIKKVLKDEFDPPEEIISLTVIKGYGFPFRLAITPHDKILGTGNFSKGRVSVYNMNGNFIKDIGKIPVVLKNEKLANQHSHGFTSRIIYKSSSKEIFVATMYGSIIEQYSLDGRMISTFHGPDTFFPKYSIVPVGKFHTMAISNETKHGYLDLYYNKKSDKLFLVYSGKCEGEDKQANYGKIIYVLNGKGIIIEEIILDTKVIQINVSEDGSTIFGLSSENEIVKFKYK